MDSMIAMVDQHIKESGQMVPFILNGHDSFAYTIGNATHGLPELLILGNFPPPVVARLLNELGQKMRDEKKALDEGVIDIDWKMPFKVRKATSAAQENYTFQASHYYGRQDYEVLQVLLPDQNGKYPGDAGCDVGFDVALV